MTTLVNPFPGIPYVESPIFEQWLEREDLSDFEKEIAVQLNERGFAVFDFPEPDFDKVAEKAIADLKNLPQFESAASIEMGLPAKPGSRIQDYIESEHVRRIASNQKVIEILSNLYGKRAFPFQTLNFAMGTQQHYHSDAAHFSSVPERYMAGVWVALEDIGPDQGPLVYYPGSHRWPIIHNDDVGHSVVRPGDKRGQDIFHDAWRTMIEVNEVEPEYFHAKRGQALIWAANLIHGGIEHKDLMKTRWSQVTHYFFEDCAYTTPMLSNPRLGRVLFRTNVSNLATAEPVENKYLGNPLTDELKGEANSLVLENASLRDFARARVRKWLRSKKAT